MMGGYGMGGYGAWGGLLGIISMLIPLAIIFLIVYIAVRAAGQSGGNAAQRKPGTESPIEIAERRFASGEISAEQLQEIRRVLADK